MPQAFPGPYVDLSLTSREPFSQVSQAEDVKNPRDLGQNRTYTNGRINVNALDLSGQQQAPKPASFGRNWPVGYNPYANGGGLQSFLANSGG